MIQFTQGEMGGLSSGLEMVIAYSSSCINSYLNMLLDKHSLWNIVNRKHSK